MTRIITEVGHTHTDTEVAVESISFRGEAVAEVVSAVEFTEADSVEVDSTEVDSAEVAASMEVVGDMEAEEDMEAVVIINKCKK